MKEVWKDIPEFEDYQVSNLGNVRSKDKETIQWNGHQNTKMFRKGRILKQHKLRGYFAVGMWKDGKMYNKQIHRLVAIAFLPNPNNYPIINHIDGNKENNNISNLEWCSYSHNVNEAYRLGLMTISNKHKDCARKLGLSSGKRVMQIDLTGNIINIFNSGRKASLELGISQSGISLCCNGKTETYRGYKWKYIEGGVA